MKFNSVKYILIFFSAFLSHFSSAQEIHFVYKEIHLPISNNEEYSHWGRVNVENCLVDSFHLFPEAGIISDFSYNSMLDDWMLTYRYYNGIESFQVDTGFYYSEIDFIYSTGDTLPGLPYFDEGFPEEDKFIEAMVCDYDGHIFAAGSGLTIYDVALDTFEYIGPLPTGMEAEGDFTYRNGKLYLTTLNNQLVEVNIEDPASSSVVATFPPETWPIEAMATFPIRCDSIVTYAIGRQDSVSKVYHLDFDSYTLTEICDINLPILGAGAPEECILPPCELTVDLDMDDSGGLTGLDFSKATICSAFYDLGDADIEVFSAIKLDSLTIAVVFPPDGVEERLYLLGNAAITVTGSGTSSLTLTDNGTATDADFAALLHDIFYHNEAALPTIGPREIVIVPHAWHYIGMPSTCYFVLDPAGLQAVATITEPSCFGFEDGSVSLEPEGLSPFTADWQNGQTGLMATGLTAGSYHYTLVDSVGCFQPQTVTLGQPDSLIVGINALSDTICIEGETTLFSDVSGGTEPYSFEWSNGSTLEDAVVGGEGPHSVIVTDIFGCTDVDSIQLTTIDTIFVTQQQILCEGDLFEWENMSFITDTLVCLNFTSFAGCDSVHCMDIQFLDTVLVQQNVILCEGDVFETGGQFFYTDTSFCQTLIAANGCDSTYCLDLQFTERDTYLFETICEGDSFTFAGQNISDAGMYVDSLVGSTGCDSLIILELSYYPEPGINFNIDGNFCVDETVTVSVNGFVEYSWSTGAQTPEVIFNAPGSYALTVTDQNGCQNSNTIQLEDNALELFYSSAPPWCFDSQEGFIIIDSVRNAQPPLEFFLDGITQAGIGHFENLGLGIYEVEAEDADGCTVMAAIELAGPQPLSLDLGEDQTILFGDTLTLPVEIDFQPSEMRWTPPVFLSCDTCLTPNLWPEYSIAYQLSATDSEGCTISDEVWLFVDKRIGIYIPNAFSPNGDGVNDYFTVFAHPSVKTLKSVQVYDRWGGMVYEQTEIPPGIESYGWDGKFNGGIAPPGVYVCRVVVKYLDGREDILTGEVMLVR